MFFATSSTKQTIRTTDMPLMKFSTIKNESLKFNNLILIYYTTKHTSSTKNVHEGSLTVQEGHDKDNLLNVEQQNKSQQRRR